MTASVFPVLAEFASWWDGMERDIVHTVTCKLHVPWLHPVFIGVQSQTLAAILVSVLVLILMALDFRQGLRVLLSAAIALGLAMALATLLWATVDRKRPPQAYDVILESPAELATCCEHPEALALRMHRAISPSFPSRHGLSIGVLVTTLLLGWRRVGVVALLYGLIAAWGRVYAGKHWASDVVAGILMGALIAWLTWRYLPRLVNRMGLGRWLPEEPADVEPTAG